MGSLRVVFGDQDCMDAPSPRWSLTELFERWFVPVVAAAEGHAPHTLELYRVALAHWVRHTGDPPLSAIDQATLARFVASLRTWRYRRGLSGAWRMLSAQRIAIVVKQIRSLLARAGHRPPGGGLCAGIDLPPVAFPQIRLVRPCKLPFTLDEARQIVAAADRFPRRCGRSDWPAVWRGLLSALYVTGHRIGTVLAVERSMFRPMGTDYQLHLPAALVPKTGKAAVQRVPAWCAGAILALPGHRPLSLGIDRRHLARLHAELQRLAGVTPLSWQAWRRTHAAMMQRLGLGFALNCAAASLQHSDWRTTATHYWDITEEVRLRLPPLWD